MGFLLMSTGKVKGELEMKWKGKFFLQLDYANEFSILDKSVSKRNELVVILMIIIFYF